MASDLTIKSTSTPEEQRNTTGYFESGTLFLQELKKMEEILNKFSKQIAMIRIPQTTCWCSCFPCANTYTLAIHSTNHQTENTDCKELSDLIHKNTQEGTRVPGDKNITIASQTDPNTKLTICKTNLDVTKIVRETMQGSTPTKQEAFTGGTYFWTFSWVEYFSKNIRTQKNSHRYPPNVAKKAIENSIFFVRNSRFDAHQSLFKLHAREQKIYKFLIAIDVNNILFNSLFCQNYFEIFY